MPYEAVIGLEVHAELATRSQDVLRLPGGRSHAGRAQHAPSARCAPGCPACCRWSTGRRWNSACAWRWRWSCTDQPDQPVRAQELLLPRPAQGLPDLAVRAAAGARTGSWSSTRRSGEKTIRIRRVHLEEDTGKLTHVRRRRGLLAWWTSTGPGVPLLEIVSEPDLRTPGRGARLCHRSCAPSCATLGVNSGDMEKGVMRFEANVSRAPGGQPTSWARGWRSRT